MKESSEIEKATAGMSDDTSFIINHRPIIPEYSDVLLVKSLNLNTCEHKVALKAMDIMKKAELKQIENDRYLIEL